MKLYLGVDTGINSAGLVLLNDRNKLIIAENFLAPKYIEVRQLKIDFMCVKFRDFLMSFKDNICCCFLENHSMSSMRISKKSTSIYDLNRLDGRYEQILFEFGIPFTYIRIDHIKGIVGCNNRSPKSLIEKNVGKIFKEDFSGYGKGSNDIADAYILARMISYIVDFKKNPKEFNKKNLKIGQILQFYSAFVSIKEIL